MRQLDRRRSARRVAIEGQQPVATVLGEHRVEVVRGDPGLLELRPTDPSARVAMLLGHADEPEEHELYGGAAAIVERLVDLLGVAAYCAGTPPTSSRSPIVIVFVVLVRNSSDRVCCTRGQPTGLQLGFGDDWVHDRWLDLHPDRGRRNPHGVHQLVRRHRPQCDGPTVDRVVEAGLGERPVEVVGVQRGDELYVDESGVGARPTSIREEGASLDVVDGLREQLLELVDRR